MRCGWVVVSNHSFETAAFLEFQGSFRGSSVCERDVVFSTDVGELFRGLNGRR